MKRIVAPCALAALALAGCSPDDGIGISGSGLQMAANIVADGAPSTGQLFAYRHSLQMEMELESVEPRFERTRDYCLEDVELGCFLENAELNVGDSNYGATRYGVIAVTLPHDSVAIFEERLVVPLLDENPGDAIIVSRSTVAQNVTKEVSDLDARMAQLAAYRDRLTELGERGDVTVDELIRIAQELSETQQELAGVTARQGSVSQQALRERMTVTFYARPGWGETFRPLSRALGQSVGTLAESTASAIRFAIAVIPWLPIVAAGFFLFSWLFRLVRRRLLAKPMAEVSVTDTRG